MGIAGIGDAFSAKYPTLQIFGRDGSWHVVPLRRVTGTMVLVKIQGRIYPFILDASKFRTYRYKGAKTIQTILYSLEDAIPLDIEKLQKLVKNSALTGVRKIDVPAATMLLRAAELLLGDEKRDFIPVTEIGEDMQARGEDPGALVADFVGQHNITSIVRPVPEITEYLTDRLMLSPSLIANGIMLLRQMDNEWRKIANPAKSPFQHWLLVIVAVCGLAIAGGVIYTGIEEGWIAGGVGGELEDLITLANLYPSPDAVPGAAPGICMLGPWRPPRPLPLL